MLINIAGNKKPNYFKASDGENFGISDEMGYKKNSVRVIYTDERYGVRDRIEVQPDTGVKYKSRRGVIIHEERAHNLVVDTGRQALLELPFGLSSTTFLFGGVGSSNANPSDPTQTGLTTELTTGGPATRPGLLDLTNSALSTGDVVASINGSNRWALTVQYTYTTAQFNALTFYEFGLFSVATFSTGVMIARFVAASSFLKSSAFAATIQWTLRA